jgi:hypothetical protein
MTWNFNFILLTVQIWRRHLRALYSHTMLERANARLVTTAFIYINVPLSVILAVFLLQGQSEQHPKKLLLSHILIKVSAVDAGQRYTDEINLARKRAEEILGAVRSGASFANLAEQYSDDGEKNL